MGWVELSPDSRLGYAKDIEWYPTLVAAGSSGWSASIARYKRVGDLILGQAVLSGSSVTYGPNNWTLGGLPATPRTGVGGGGVYIGYTYYYNVGRASYGSLLYAGGVTYFAGIDASNNELKYWNGSIFNGAAGGRSIFIRLQYEAA
jgi:hypothetical protein